MALLRFPKAARLARAAEFNEVKQKGATFHGKFFVLSVLNISATEPARTGFITSRRVGGAVKRNRVRRRLRELVRTSRPQLRAGFWIVLIARAAATRATWNELQEEWLSLGMRSRVLNP